MNPIPTSITIYLVTIAIKLKILYIDVGGLTLDIYTSVA
jgi:hypothetical protein